MNSYVLASYAWWTFLLAAMIVAIIRWFHPAVFSEFTLIILILLSILFAVFTLYKRQS